MQDNEPGEIILKGIGGSPGICIGKAYLVDREGVNVVEKYYIRKESLSNEVNRFKAAVKSGKEELAAIIDETPEELQEHVSILETHMALYKDKMLYGRTINTIEKEMVNAEWALKNVVHKVKAMFRSISDPYLRGRSDDIVHVSDSIMRHLVGVGEEDIGGIDKRVILVAYDLSPADTAQIKLDRVKGFVTDRGGKASHTGIIARTLGIPCVMGIDSVASLIKTDDIIILNGETGTLIIQPTDRTILHYEELRRRYNEYRIEITRESRVPVTTSDGVPIQIMGNIEMPDEAISVIENGGEGVGLLRTEFMYLRRKNFPDEEELFSQYKSVVKSMAPRPVAIRTLDINGDKAISYMTGPDEPNPALGLRAIRFCLKRPDVFKAQLRAILRAAAFGNVEIIFPMISGYEEVIETKKLLKDAADCLKKEGLLFNSDIKIGIMVEVPSAAVIADILADEVDFFSIGTNDLVQYTLAIDRGNKDVSYLYHPLNPAVIRLVDRVVKVGKEKETKVIMCGEMAGDPFNFPILLGLGIEAFSMTPHSIPHVKRMIKKINRVEAEELTREAMKLKSTGSIVNLVQETYGEILMTPESSEQQPI